MKHIIIIGAGGHAAELRDYIQHHNAARPLDQIELVGLLDDNKKNYEHYGFSEPFLGGIQAHVICEEVYYLMGIANLAYRKPLIEKFLEGGARFTGLIHPTAIVSPFCKIGEGTVVSHSASIGANARLGKFNMLNSRCTIGHDTRIGDYNFISPQVVTGGFTRIGNDNFLGTNAAVLPKISIGDDNTISAGMIVDKHLTTGQTIFHRFKEKVMVVTS